LLLSLQCEAGYCCCRCDAKLVLLPLRDVKVVLPLRDAKLVLLLRDAKLVLLLRDAKLVLLLQDAKMLLLLRDAKVVVDIAVRLNAGDRGRCCYSCHCRHKVCSFLPHCLEGITTVAIGRDRIAGNAIPSRVAIYNDDPTRSLKIVCFKWVVILTTMAAAEDAMEERNKP